MRADQFLYVFYVLQYVNGHAEDCALLSEYLYFTYTNSVILGERPHNAAFILGLCCL